MDKDLVNVLIERNLAFMEQVASTTMTWWVSSIVFCASIIGLSWWHRERVALLPQLHVVCGVNGIFFLSFPLYAGWVVYIVHQIEAETLSLLIEAGASGHLPFTFQGIKFAVSMGGFCFIAGLVLWIVVWWDLWEFRKASSGSSGDRHTPNPASASRRTSGGEGGV